MVNKFIVTLSNPQQKSVLGMTVKCEDPPRFINIYNLRLDDKTLLAFGLGQRSLKLEGHIVPNGTMWLVHVSSQQSET